MGWQEATYLDKSTKIITVSSIPLRPPDKTIRENCNQSCITDRCPVVQEALLTVVTNEITSRPPLFYFTGTNGELVALRGIQGHNQSLETGYNKLARRHPAVGNRGKQNASFKAVTNRP